jgi:hypothetical protein
MGKWRAMTHFIEGVHTSLDNEFLFTWAGPFERFLKWQRIKYPHAVAQGEDWQSAIARLDVKKAQKQIVWRGQNDQEEEVEEAKISTKRMKVADLVQPLAHGLFGLAANLIANSYG